MNKLLFSLLVLAATGPAHAQFVPGAPIVKFQLPMFNPQGFKTWEVRGATGRYLEANRIEITALELNIFSGDEADVLETEISSPLAIVQPQDRLVSGPGPLRAKGQGFDLFGEDWTYDHNTKTVVVRRSVVLTLEGTLGNILK